MEDRSKKFIELIVVPTLKIFENVIDNKQLTELSKEEADDILEMYEDLKEQYNEWKLTNNE